MMGNQKKRWRELTRDSILAENPDIEKRIKGRCRDVGGPLGVCWLYVLPKEQNPRNKYAEIGLRENGVQRIEYVHRVICALNNGDVPAGYEVKHDCHNKRCCHPDHVKAVTPEQHRAYDKQYLDYIRKHLGDRRPLNSIFIAITQSIQAAYHSIAGTLKHTVESTPASENDLAAINALQALGERKSYLGQIDMETESRKIITGEENIRPEDGP